jgi:hypothetical protein
MCAEAESAEARQADKAIAVASNQSPWRGEQEMVWHRIAFMVLIESTVSTDARVAS